MFVFLWFIIGLELLTKAWDHTPILFQAFLELPNVRFNLDRGPLIHYQTDCKQKRENPKSFLKPLVLHISSFWKSNMFKVLVSPVHQLFGGVFNRFEIIVWKYFLENCL